MITLLKRYKSYLALISTMAAFGGTLFVKIDAYAQGKVDAGVSALKNETDAKMADVKADIRIMKDKQGEQQKQLDRLEDGQKQVINLLLEMKK